MNSKAIENEPCFRNSQITKVTIGNNIAKISANAFENCDCLTSVVIPPSLSAIGCAAFYDCSNLKSVYISDLVAWCKIDFMQEEFEMWGSNPLMYGAELYLNNQKVIDLVIPSDITEIKDVAFCKCSSLASVTIPDSVTRIGIDSFCSCHNLIKLTIPDSVEQIGEHAFASCDKLNTISFSGETTNIDIASDAFVGCSSLPIIDNIRYAGAYLVKVVNTDLHSYTIQEGTRIIGAHAFSYCDKMESIVIPNSVTSIGDSAFFECTSLKSITIPDSVTKIGCEAFCQCSAMDRLYCHAITPPQAKYEGEGWYGDIWHTGYHGDLDTFSLRTLIYVPKEYVESYKNAYGWSSYENNIIGYDF